VIRKEPAMTYATLLVPVEADAATDPRLALAADLANQFDAKLIGVGAELWRMPAVYGGFGAGYGIDKIITAEITDVAADLKQAEDKFRTAAAAVRRGFDWRSAVQFPIAEVAAGARAADLVVTSRSRHPGASEYNVAAPGALVLQAGRPVLVAPPEMTRLELQSVVVAWKDTREARRAITDALPFLTRVGAVLVAEVCDHQDAATAGARLADVAEYLLRHGVRASTVVCVEQKGVDPAHQFLELAEQHKADLIVAGAYGRSRFQEWVFGGFTTALLTQTSRAVLLSH
jgi:nucleotide-binding universal stress UspA family protein